MKHRLLTIALGVSAFAMSVVCGAAPSLAWVNNFTGTTPDGGDFCTIAGADSAGNVYAVGTVLNGTFPNDYADIVIVKYNAAGAVQWTRTYDRNGFDDVAYDAKVDAAGNVYVCGYSSLDGTSTDTDVLALKVTSANVVSFANTYVPPAPNLDEFSYSIAVDAGGGVYIGGEAGGTGVGAGLPYDAAILRFNSAGVFQWRRVYTGTLGDYDRFNEVKVASNGDVVGCGFIANTNSDGLVARLTSANVQVFQDTYNTGYVGGTALNENDATGVALDASGNAYVCGVTYKDTSPNDRQEMFVRKYTPAGVLSWTSLYDGAATGITTANDIAVDSAGNTYTVGETTVGGVAEVNANQYIRKLSTAGAVAGTNTRDGGFGDFYSSVGIVANGTVIAGGWSNLDGTAVPVNKDGIITEYNPSTLGQTSVTPYNGAGNDWDEWNDMVVVGSDIYVTGFTYVTFSDANGLVARYTTTTLINPSSYTIVTGTGFGGNLASLFASDDNKLVILCDEFTPNGDVRFFSTSPTTTPSLYRLWVEVSSSRNDVGSYTQVFNYTTNAFVLVDFRVTTFADVQFQANAGGTLSQLIGPANAIQSRHQSIPTQDIDSGDGWTVSLDRWQWEIQ